MQLKSIKQFVNESFVNESASPSYYINQLLSSHDKYTKAEIKSIANWDKDNGFALSASLAALADKALVLVRFRPAAYKAYIVASTIAARLFKSQLSSTNAKFDIEILFIDAMSYKLISKWSYNYMQTRATLISLSPDVKLSGVKEDLHALDTVLQSYSECIAIAYQPAALTKAITQTTRK